MQFVIRTSTCQTICTLHHLQLMLSFIAIKHSHVQQILGFIRDEGVYSEDESIDLNTFLLQLQALIARLRYTNPLMDLEIAWDIVNKNESVCILLGGTSGCGKSTLASLLAHRIGITTVLSTDHVRSLLRSFDPKKESAILWASSYHAGESSEENSTNETVVTGYEAQSQLLFDSLDQMITGFRQRKESLVIEGVGLSVANIKRLAEKHPNCIPLIVYISNEQKHTERFAIRAKYMTVAPRSNKYIRYFDNIRLIQSHLCQQADEWMIPKVDNTNVDRSLAILHMTVLHVLARLRVQHKTFTPHPVTHKFDIVHTEFAKVHHATWSSKQMLRQIRQNSLRTRTDTSRRISSTKLTTEGQQQQQRTEQNNQGASSTNTLMSKSSSVLLACQARWKGVIRSWTNRS
ncbi:hypothetical protein K492DRAFT_240179 [Lichtheimia hyalospora FSU 10163]|nr:hypothetical protein K492DRAFT_240179 [Lichtheimia hyalospora FSU 10163]